MVETNMYLPVSGTVSLPEWKGDSNRLGYSADKVWMSDRFKKLMLNRLEKTSLPPVELQYTDLGEVEFWRDDSALTSALKDQERIFGLVELYIRLAQLANETVAECSHKLRRDTEYWNFFPTLNAHVQTYWIPGVSRMHIDAGSGRFLPRGSVRVFLKP